MPASTAIEPRAIGRAHRGAAIASHPICVALAITAIITALRAAGTVDSDTAWQLWIAQRIHAGAHLYLDIVETNPPLWFWMALPIDRVASLLHVRIDAVLIVAIGFLAAVSLAATDRLVGHIEPRRRRLLLGYAALVLCAMPWMHVGQREQIVLIGSIPYAALCAARARSDSIPPILAALIGAGAAVGFALKHYFLIVPALLEMWLWASQRGEWRLRRPEIVALVAVGAAYACTILAFAPDFLTRILPLLRLAYGDTGAPSFALLFGPMVLVGLGIVALIAVHFRLLERGRAPFATVLLVACIGFAAAYFIQSKGWVYHAIPLLGCASLALAALLAETEAPPPSLRTVAPALLILPFLLAFEEQRHAVTPGDDLTGAVAGMRPGDAVGFLATDTAVAWSVTLQHRLRYTQRYNGYWMLRAVVRNEQLGSPNPRLVRLGHQIVGETVVDFTCRPPQRIIVARPRPGEDAFDILPFFLRDPQFAALLSHYKAVSRSSFETYVLASPLPGPAVACRSGHLTVSHSLGICR